MVVSLRCCGRAVHDGLRICARHVVTRSAVAVVSLVMYAAHAALVACLLVCYLEDSD